MGQAVRILGASPSSRSFPLRYTFTLLQLLLLLLLLRLIQEVHQKVRNNESAEVIALR